MRDDPGLEREKSDRWRPWSKHSRTGAALVLVLALAGAPLGAADRPDLRFPDPSPALPEAVSPARVAPMPTSSTGDVRLVWFDPMALFPDGVGRVGDEVTRLFRGLGVRVRWESGADGAVLGDGEGVEIPLILLPSDPMPGRASRRVMGLVPKSSPGLRAVWVFLDNVRWTLGHHPRARTMSAREGEEVGLALARVVAHEVVHAVAPDAPHTEGGLMHHSLDRGFLLGAQAPVDPRCTQAFLRKLAESVVPAGSPSDARAAEGRPAFGP